MVSLLNTTADIFLINIPFFIKLTNAFANLEIARVKKSLSLLYLFIDRYKNSGIKEFATFASGLDKDVDAVENAVASDLSNGFVEGTNTKTVICQAHV